MNQKIMKHTQKYIVVVTVLFLVGFLLSSCQAAQRRGSGRSFLSQRQTPAFPIKRVTPIREHGGRVDWSHKLNLIAFDQEGQDGYFDLYTMDPDGSNVVCLTCNKPRLPGRHMGQPAWHPSGEYIVFQAEEPGYTGHSIFSSPGWGIGNNLWIITKDGEKYWKLTDISPHLGVLHPHFSHDGKKLLWTEIHSGKGGKSAQRGLRGKDFGKFWATRDWSLKVADFVFHGGVPQLENIKQYHPGERTCYFEAHGFSKDDKKILFASTFDHGNWWGPDIYFMDLETEKLKRLTFTDKDWDEHAHLSPNGEKIIWSTNRNYKRKGRKREMRLEYWLMNVDGTEKVRATFFNELGYAESMGHQVLTGDNAWNSDGTKIVAYIVMVDVKNPRSRLFPNRTTRIVVIEFNGPL